MKVVICRRCRGDRRYVVAREWYLKGFCSKRCLWASGDPFGNPLVAVPISDETKSLLDRARLNASGTRLQRFVAVMSKRVVSGSGLSPGQLALLQDVAAGKFLRTNPPGQPVPAPRPQVILRKDVRV